MKDTKLEIITSNILETPANALLLTIDGSKRGMEGNLARQFERRWPEDWTDMQRDIPYPIPLGRTVAVPWDGDCPWQWLLFASTLHHLDVISDYEKQSVVRNAFFEALVHCQRHRICSLATTVLRGGWRLQIELAFSAMRDAWLASHAATKGPNVKVFVMQASDHALLHNQ